MAGLISRSTVGILFALVRGTAAGSVAGVGFGLVFAPIVGLLFGGAAVMQHYVMRAFLVRARVAPLEIRRIPGGDGATAAAAP